MSWCPEKRKAFRRGVLRVSKPKRGHHNERPLSMRLRRADLRRRVNGRMEYRCGLQQVTSHAGLELVREFVQGRRFRERVRRLVGNAFPNTDFGTVAMLLLLLGLLMVGGRRIWHLRYVQFDPILARFAGLRRLPFDKDRKRVAGAAVLESRGAFGTAQLGGGRRGSECGGTGALDDRCRWLGGLYWTDGRRSEAWLQSSPPEGPELLPDHRLRGAVGPDPAGREPSG